MTETTPSFPFEDQALEAIRAGGLRVTQPRRSIIRFLAESKVSMTVPTLHAAVNATGSSIDLASVYRIIDALELLGLVHRIASTDGYSACQVGHAHTAPVEHLVCVVCGTVAERQISPDAVLALSQEAASTGFKARAMQIEVLGECRDCADKPRDA